MNRAMSLPDAVRSPSLYDGSTHLERGEAAPGRVSQLRQCANAVRFSFSTDGSGASSDSKKVVTSRMSVSR